MSDVELAARLQDWRETKGWVEADPSHGGIDHAIDWVAVLVKLREIEAELSAD